MAEMRSQYLMHLAGISILRKRIPAVNTSSLVLTYPSIRILSKSIGRPMVDWISWVIVEAFTMLFLS